jgi:hypothetical protein
MAKRWWRVIGVALMGAGGVGLTACLTGLILVGQIERDASALLTERLDLTARSLTVTAEGLAVADDSLTRAGVTLAALQGTAREVERGIGNAQVAADRISGVVGRDMRAVLGTTQTGLAAAESAALAIDTTIDLVTAFLPNLRPAEPGPPLSLTIAQVAGSLQGLDHSLGAVEADLKTSSDDLRRVRVQVGLAAGGLGEIGDSLAQTRLVIGRYRLVVADLQRDIGRLQAALPGWLGTLRWVLSATLVCLTFAQLGLIVQGWRLYQRSE